MTAPNAHEAFTAALHDLAPPEAIARMVAHWDQVCVANVTQNLTGIRDAAQAAQTLYRDALMGAHLLLPGSLVDFGSGAGYPGLVYAALDPARPVALVEPRRLRANFLTEAVAALGWQQVSVHACKVQARPPGAFANVVCRAVFADDQDFAAAAAWLAPEGQLLSFRGASAPLGTTAGPLRRQQSVAYQVGERAGRIDVWRRAATP